MDEENRTWYGQELEDVNALRRAQQWEEQKFRDIEAQAAEFSNAEPSGLDTVTAAFKLYNPITSYIVNEPLPDTPYQVGYNPAEDIEGYERYWQAFVDSNNPETTAVIKRRIDREMRNRQIIQNSDDLTNIASTVAAGFSDPFNLALMMVPGAAFVKAGRIGQSAVRTAGIGAVATVASEATLYQTQETRQAEEAITNLVATASIDAILGAGSAKWLGQANYDQLVKEVENHIASPTGVGVRGASDQLSGPLSAGAAEAGGTATGAPMKRATAFFKFTGLEALGRQAMKINPLGRLVLSDSTEVRKVTQELAEMAVEFEGDYVPNAVETLIKRDLRQTDVDIAYGRALQKKSGMSPEDFSSAVTIAQRRGDTSSNPQVQKLAEYLRPRMNDQWRRAAEARIPGSFREVAEYTDEAGNLVKIPVEQLNTPAGRKILEKSEIVVEPIESNTAQSFLRRVYDINKVRQNPEAFRRAWKEGLIDRQHRHNLKAQQQLENAADLSPERVAEIKKSIVEVDDDFLARLDEAVIDIDEKVRNLRPGDMHYQEVAPGSGMFKSRVDILDEFVEDFLIDDWERLYTGYMKNTSSRIHMAERFGEGDGDFMMTGQFNRMREKFNAERVKLEEAGDTKGAKKLTDRFNAQERDLMYIRDSLLGLLHQTPYGDNRNLFLTGILRTARSFNVATKLNSVLTASIPDMARVATYNGGRRFAPAMRQALKSLPLESMPKNELQRITQASERVSSVRLQQYSEVDDALPLTKAENIMKWVSDKAMTVSGIRHWNSMLKGVVGGMVGDRIALAVKSGKDLKFLRQAGFSDDMIDEVARQVRKHATKDDGLWGLER